MLNDPSLSKQTAISTEELKQSKFKKALQSKAKESLYNSILNKDTQQADITIMQKREKVDIEKELEKLDRIDRKKHRSPSVEEGDGVSRALKRV